MIGKFMLLRKDQKSEKTQTVPELLEEMEEKNVFYDGQEVNALFWDDSSEVVTGNHGIEKITVVMENGQMAGVPWFAVWKNGCISAKHNGALIQSVTLFKEADRD